MGLLFSDLVRKASIFRERQCAGAGKPVRRSLAADRRRPQPRTLRRSQHDRRAVFRRAHHLDRRPRRRKARAVRGKEFGIPTDIGARSGSIGGKAGGQHRAARCLAMHDANWHDTRIGVDWAPRDRSPLSPREIERGKSYGRISKVLCLSQGRVATHMAERDARGWRPWSRSCSVHQALRRRPGPGEATTCGVTSPGRGDRTA